MAGTGFGWILLACALYGFIHSLLASNGFKRAAARMVGQRAYQMFYRLFFVIAAVITTGLLLALVPLLPDRTLYAIRAPWLYLTLALQALAAAALAVGLLQTGAMRFLGLRQIFESTQAAAPEKLIVSGLYRWVRHPLYTAALVFIWLSPVMTWNLLALYLGITAYLLIGTIFEEQKLVEQFGAAYREYRERTPRIIPGMKRPR
jgi:protein-S-isoprenylcysteine O-methyltransferase Ste14